MTDTRRSEIDDLRKKMDPSIMCLLGLCKILGPDILNDKGANVKMLYEILNTAPEEEREYFMRKGV